jgi:hypothetical protein
MNHPSIQNENAHIPTILTAVMAGINLAHAGEPAEAPGTRTDAAPKQQIRLERVRRNTGGSRWTTHRSTFSAPMPYLS